MLLRHAKSDWSSAGMSDRERPLNRRGRESAPKVGAYIAKAGIVPERIACSSAVRTRETCDLILAELPSPVPVTYEGELYEAPPNAILNVVHSTPRRVHSLLVIGHNPGLQEAALALVSSGDAAARKRLREKFPTAALAVIDFPIDDWSDLKVNSGRLERFITRRRLGGTE
jgi:phosphohistidine phosphatase